MKNILVSMDEMAFTKNKDFCLLTKGVTTCIAFAIRGSYWDEESEEVTSFCGLYHWQGLMGTFDDDVSECISVLDRFFLNLRTTLEIPDEEEITIKSFQFFGGEKAQYDEQNQLSLSGTENDVLALAAAVKEYEYADDFLKIKMTDVGHFHYLTSHHESMAIEVTLEQSIATNESLVDNDERSKISHLSPR